MMSKRKRYSAEFKARVSLDSLHDGLTASRLATQHRMHQTVIRDWNRRAVDGLAKVFAGKTEA